jgi:hypothetical protein
MRLADHTFRLGMVVCGVAVWGCGVRPPQGGKGIGTVGGGGGTETLNDGGSSGAMASSGTASGASGNSGATGAASGASGSSDEAADAGDAGTGGLHLSIGGPVHLVSLTWTVNGPNTYKGSVEFGDAQSVEWVVGGILAGSGYTLSVTATDAGGDPCDGTSPPFSVEPGTTTYTILTIVCHTTSTDAADVSTGSVAIDASVTLED